MVKGHFWKQWTWTCVFGLRFWALDLHLQSKIHEKVHSKIALIVFF